MSSEADPMLSRLKILPLRLRIVHLAALLRRERQAIVGARSYPFPREAAGREGRSEAEARVGGPFLAAPTLPLSGRRFASPGSFASTSRASLLASDPTAGEGLNTEPTIPIEPADDRIMPDRSRRGGDAG
jgi:hypothetical protein